VSEIYPDYEDLVNSLAKPGKEIITDMTPKKAHIQHMAIGISGEAGELTDAIKKWVIYGKPLDVENVIEELGDIEFYLQGLRSGLGISRDQVIDANTTKLNKRYSSGQYSDKQAQDRSDKTA